MNFKMSRTSATQFEVIVDFMERNGDLNKPADGPHGRLNAINKWADLTRVLNLDTTGTSKTVDKWKKVWSDLKNNTKRKAAKIHRAAGGTGGGPACRLVLTDLEQRVLALTGSQAATGLLNIEEVGVEIDQLTFNTEATPAPPPAPAAAAPAPPPQSPTPFQLDVSQVEDMSEDWDGLRGITPFVEVTVHGVESPTAHSAHVGSPIRPVFGRSPRRPVVGRSPILAAPMRPRRSPRTGRRRVIRPRQSRPRPQDAAASQFVACDERWQKLSREFGTEHFNLRKR
ncbi:uncharacterized protein LOC125489427 [Plutella xylostella]|uniref:uncharacterized protein LOC125489427 n=1 Tax=Plutella xylostella TaxID=51655 RepID=UPI0020323DC0|nr:uncharacterized protein LOC125489427 [Plutella xylostella]